MLAVGLLVTGTGTLLLWGALKGEDPLASLINLVREGKLSSDGAWRIEPVSTSPITGGGSTTQGGSVQLGGVTKWGKASVADYGKQLSRAFGVHVISHCRPGAITRSGNPSLHGKCLALDLKGPRKNEEALARWAVASGVFAEVIYTHETTPGYSDMTIADHDGRSGTRHVHIGFKPSSKTPIPSVVFRKT